MADTEKLIERLSIAVNTPGVGLNMIGGAPLFIADLRGILAHTTSLKAEVERLTAEIECHRLVNVRMEKRLGNALASTTAAKRRAEAADARAERLESALPILSKTIDQPNG